MSEYVDSGIKVPMLTGFVENETDTHVRFRTSAGTWVFKREDIVAIVEPEGADAPPEARCMEISAGAVGEFTQLMRIEVTQRPMTASGEFPPSAGDEQLEEMTQAWAVRVDAQFDKEMMARAHSWTSSATKSGTCGPGGFADDYENTDSLD